MTQKQPKQSRLARWLPGRRPGLRTIAGYDLLRDPHIARDIGLNPPPRIKTKHPFRR